VRRLLDFFLRNWLLKLGAVALATILYGGLVLSESTLTWRGQVPIDVVDPPQDAAVGTVPVQASDIRYRAPLDVAGRLTNGSFVAFVDLSGIRPQAGSASVRVRVQVQALDPSVSIVDYEPEFVEILVEPLVTREMRVSVHRGIIPDRLDVGPPQVEPPTVTLRGGASRLQSVTSVVARVNIDGSAINVDEEAEVEPLDALGAIVAGVEVDPERVRVRITVAPSIETATLPVRPRIEGEVAAGYMLEAVDVEPISVTVSGAETDVATLGLVQTEPIDITGRTGIIEVDAALDLPAQVNVSGTDTVIVTLEIVPAAGARTFQTGLTLASTQADLAYSLSASSVLVTLSGALPVLAALDAGSVLGVASVAGLGPGRHELAVSLEPPPGTELEIVEPSTVVVSISQAPPLVVSPAPAPVVSPSPGSSPSGPISAP